MAEERENFILGGGAYDIREPHLFFSSPTVYSQLSGWENRSKGLKNKNIFIIRHLELKLYHWSDWDCSIKKHTFFNTDKNFKQQWTLFMDNNGTKIYPKK